MHTVYHATMYPRASSASVGQGTYLCVASFDLLKWPSEAERYRGKESDPHLRGKAYRFGSRERFSKNLAASLNNGTLNPAESVSNVGRFHL